MSEQQIEKARLLQKRDTDENWKSSDITLGAGEIGVFVENQEGPNSVPRLKIGDGQSDIEDLGFLTGEVYTSKDEPKNAGIGAIWVNTSSLKDSIQVEEPTAEMDWNAKEGAHGSIANRPLWYEPTTLKRDEALDEIEILMNNEEITLFQKSPDWSKIYIAGKELVGTNLIFTKNGKDNVKKTIDGYCDTVNQLLSYFTDAAIKSTTEKVAVAAAGTIFGFSAYTSVILIGSSESDIQPIAFVTQNRIIGKAPTEEGQGSNFIFLGGFYFIDQQSFTEGEDTLELKAFSYNQVHIKTQYQPFFEGLSRPIHIMQIGSEQDLDKIAGMDFTNFNPGDIMLLVTESLTTDSSGG